MNRCTGHCCRKFFLPFTPDQLKAEHEKAIAWDVGGLDRVFPRYDPVEMLKVAPMVIPISEANGGYHYTCKHFDGETGNCRDYENRPKMCSDYPYGSACTFSECTWEYARVVPAERLTCKTEVSL